MTYSKSPLKAAAILSAFAIAAVAAPTAIAADGAYSKVSERAVSKVLNKRQDRGNRAVRSAHNDRESRGNRGARNDRGTRSNRSNRADRGHHNNRSRTDRHRQGDFVRLRDNRSFRFDRRNSRRGYSNDYRRASYNINRRSKGFRHNGYRSNYRSGLGINFSFGSPGYSSYRWAPSNYGFYRPGRVSFASYRNQTRCDRVIVDGFQYGTLRPVSVKQCYNPWDGYYIIQGSERIAYNAW